MDDVGEEGDEGGRDWMASSTFLSTSSEDGGERHIQECSPLKFLLGNI